MTIEPLQFTQERANAAWKIARSNELRLNSLRKKLTSLENKLTDHKMCHPWLKSWTAPSTFPRLIDQVTRLQDENEKLRVQARKDGVLLRDAEAGRKDAEEEARKWAKRLEANTRNAVLVKKLDALRASFVRPAIRPADASTHDLLVELASRCDDNTVQFYTTPGEEK